MIAGPGHGGSRYRVKTRKDLSGRHIGQVQRRMLCFWLNVPGGYVVGFTPVDALHRGQIKIEAYKALKGDRDRKVVTYL